MEKETKYLNPYLAGFFLGLLLIATIFITSGGLGASGAFKSVVVYAVDKVTPQHAENTAFYKSYNAEHNNAPLKNWLVFEIIGVIIGAFISGLISKRLTFEVEHSPKIKSGTRLIFALLGGALFGLGAQFGRGCTSGAALTGMGVLSAGGFITMFAIFGSAYLLAYFFRKLWI
ncbi:MAG TPA: YeeE/YedE thiosulfate transporter family protein [Ignavibacteria bacterium]|nr:YeeE/YedE thiosulfate transporter family protein [Ignavibacteria bacterium]